MPEIMNPDGTWTEVTKAEYIEMFGEEDWRELTAPSVDPADMTEGERYLANKMQAEAETNAVLSAAGYESIFDLPMESDDDVPDLGELENLPPREYDDAGALADLEAREAHENES